MTISRMVVRLPDRPAAASELACDCQGEVEIWREVGTTSVLLGHVRAGEWLGEMGIIENRRRSATARAGTDVEAEILSARQFLDRVAAIPHWRAPCYCA